MFTAREVAQTWRLVMIDKKLEPWAWKMLASVLFSCRFHWLKQQNKTTRVTFWGTVKICKRWRQSILTVSKVPRFTARRTAEKHWGRRSWNCFFQVFRPKYQGANIFNVSVDHCKRDAPSLYIKVSKLALCKSILRSKIQLRSTKIPQLSRGVSKILKLFFFFFFCCDKKMHRHYRNHTQSKFSTKFILDKN